MPKKMPFILSKKFLQSEFIYNSDGTLTCLKNRGTRKFGDRIRGCLHHRGYRWVSIKGQRHAFHRVIWVWHYGNTSKKVDHRNRNRQDNKIENLRLASRSQNAFNSKISKRNSSGVRGIYWLKNEKTWSASIMIDGKRIKLGQSKEKIIAEAFYLGAARALRGEFLNEKS